MIQHTQKGLGLSELRTDELEALLRLIYKENSPALSTDSS